MSDDREDSGALEYLILVRFDPVQPSLTIEHPQLFLRPGDLVFWDFTGIPQGWAPWIELKLEQGPWSFLGPFASLSQIEGGIRGQVMPASDELLPDLFTYRACIQKGCGLDWQAESAAVCSRQATIKIHVEPPLPTVFFHVSLQVDGHLAVEPPSQSLKSGQSVVWIFEGIPDDSSQWRPRIDFGRYEGDDTVSTQALGPFTCLMYTAGRVTGLGNSGVTGHYHFAVSVISVSSGEVRWVNSSDPVIDNQGPIWDPVSGGPSG